MNLLAPADKCLHKRSPLIDSVAFNYKNKARVWLKMEAMQPCGSFKARGIGHACQHYVAAGATSLLSSSGGNAGLAVAWAGRRLNVPVTVIVPETTKQRAIDLIRAENANVIITGSNWDEAHQYAMNRVRQNVAYIHPFDDPNIWQGHATVIAEVADMGIKPDIIVLSVGGGGLLCGVAEGLARQDWKIPILAVETQGAGSFNASAVSGQHVAIEEISSIATSLGARKIASKAFDLLSEYEVHSQLVSDQQAVNGCWRFLNDHRVLVEPACGASLATVYNGCQALEGKKKVLIIVCGGVGVTIEQLLQWRQDVSQSSS